MAKKSLKKKKKKVTQLVKDTWSLDMAFLDWVIPRLKVLQKNKHGYPSDLSERQWDAIMEDMIEGFEKCKVYLNKTYDDGWKTYPYESPDTYHEGFGGATSHPISRSFYLFTKYFYNLWD